MDDEKVIFRFHALNRMFQRRIRKQNVYRVLGTGETIEDYPKSHPFPSRLVLGCIDFRPLHVVVGFDERLGLTYIVTAYEPDPSEWEPGFRRRHV
ncbi:MAG: DUF4258 domain-containing protein [SAR202 cluster bacterium]|nr:DUF4258 domain-containing protein [SAR202 cluster bacterium]